MCVYMREENESNVRKRSTGIGHRNQFHQVSRQVTLTGDRSRGSLL